MNKKQIIDDFHRLYYSSGNWQNNSKWMGKRILKCPMDLLIYQEVIFKNRPDLIIETGTAFGASSLFCAQMMDLAKIDGRVITIDVVENKGLPRHPKIIYINGSSTKANVLKQLKGFVKKHERIMGILDSDHSKIHVLHELQKIGKWITQGQYLIVEDTNINDNPVRVDFGSGPREAIEEFMKKDDTFEIDYSMEKHLLTFNPGGYLKKIKPSEFELKRGKNDKAK